MFLTESLGADLFLAHSDLAGLSATCLNECHFDRFVRNGIHYAVDSISRRRRNGTCFLTRNLKLNGKFGTYEEVIQFGITVHSHHGVGTLHVLRAIKLNGIVLRRAVGIEQAIFRKQCHAIMDVLLAERQTLSGLHFLLVLLICSRLLLQPFVKINTEFRRNAYVRLFEFNGHIGLTVQFMNT